MRGLRGAFVRSLSLDSFFIALVSFGVASRRDGRRPEPRRRGRNALCQRLGYENISMIRACVSSSDDTLPDRAVWTGCPESRVSGAGAYLDRGRSRPARHSAAPSQSSPRDARPSPREESNTVNDPLSIVGDSRQYERMLIE